MLFDLELVSPCNAKCSFCPQSFRGVKRKRPLMDEDLLDKITTEICEMALGAPQDGSGSTGTDHVGISPDLPMSERFQVSLCGMGENLLRKPLVIRALTNLEEGSNGRIETLLVTNGSHLTTDLLEHEAFRSLDAIQVSFTGHGKDAYEEIFGLSFERVVDNVTEMASKFPGMIYIRTVDLNREKAHRDEFESFWRDRGLSVSFSDYHSRGGHIADPEAYPGTTRPFKGCEIFNEVTFISSDGEVLSCCHDITSETTIGDCRVATLAEIISRKQELQTGDFQGFRICSKCTDFTLASSAPMFVE